MLGRTFVILTNNSDRITTFPVIKLFSLSAVFLLQTACGGGGGDTAEASAIGIQDVAIAYIKRPTPRDMNGNISTNDMSQPATFNQGGDLYIQPRATAAANSKNVTSRVTNGLGDVKDVSVSYDGTKLIFSLRLEDPNPNDDTVPSWNLYEYNIQTDSLSPLISAGKREDGDDLSPRYLPDDRIIFASTRQKTNKSIRVDEGRGTFTAVDENRSNPSFALHILELDGTIKQVSINESNDLDPIVLKDSGRVVFSRWNNMGSRNDISLYSMNPDGTDVQLYYGAHSHNTGQDPNTAVHFYKPREMEDGRILSILRPLETDFGGGDIIFINGKEFADNTQPIWTLQGFVSGEAQSTFKQNLITANGLPLKGRYNAAFPMLDGSNRYLMSWAQCQILEIPTDPNSRVIPCTLATQAQLNDVNAQEAPPSYGIFLVDETNNTQVPLVKPETDTLFSEVVMTYATKKPPIIFDKVPGVSPELNQGFATEGVGVLHIRSVYDFDNSFSTYATTMPSTDNDGNPITIDSPSKIANPKNTTADQRPARFIRITKSVSFSDPLPAPNGNSLVNTAFGRSTQQGMREIIGYAPVEPDGSVKIKIPANVPLTVSVLDKDGRRISNRHQYWFQVKPGETLECIGCHVHDTANQDTNKPHGRPYTTSSFNQGAPTTGVGFPFSLDSLWAEIEETMAETRARHSCLPTNPNPCNDMKPSTDLIYADVWTDEVASNRSSDASFTIDYTDTPVSPIDLASATRAATACANSNYDDTISSFTFCRIIINYEQHIHPIWDKARGADTCTNCHTTIGNTQVAAGQLELTDGISADENDHLISYRELLFNDDEQEELVPGTLTDKMVQDTDNNGNLLFLTDANGNQILDINNNPIPIMVKVTVSPSMSVNGARASYFMEKMTNTELNAGRALSGTTDHSNMLTASELKLIAEWLDIGAQYFNNPLDPAVPTN